MWNLQSQRADLKGLEHLWTLVSVGGPGTNPLWISRGDCNSFWLQGDTNLPPQVTLLSVNALPVWSQYICKTLHGVLNT